MRRLSTSTRSLRVNDYLVIRTKISAQPTTPTHRSRARGEAAEVPTDRRRESPRVNGKREPPVGLAVDQAKEAPCWYALGRTWYNAGGSGGGPAIKADGC